MSGLTRETRLQVMLTEDELRALDDWRFKFRLPSRASAIRELLKRGLAAAEGIAVVTNANGTGNKRSSDFGVVEEKPAAARRKQGNGAAKTT